MALGFEVSFSQKTEFIVANKPVRQKLYPAKAYPPYYQQN